MNDTQFLMEVAEVMKLSFLVCSVPVACNGVQTRVLIDTLGKPTRTKQQPFTVSREHLFPTLHNLFAHF